jgi:hypothetical protein
VDGVAYTWDDNGNLLSDGIRTHSYDHANRLITASGPQLAVSEDSLRKVLIELSINGTIIDSSLTST